MRSHYVLYPLLFTTIIAVAETLTIPSTLYKRCRDGKESSACYELADLYQQTSVPGDVAIGNQYVKYGCKLEKQRICALEEANEARAQYMKLKKGWAQEKEKLLAQMPTLQTEDEKKCTTGDGEACYQAALHFKFLAPTLNPEKAKALYEEGCRLKHEPSCETLELIRKGIIRVYDVEI